MQSKATDCKQKLEIVGIYDNLPLNCLQPYGIKIRVFKEHDKQLKLTRPFIENKFFEIAKEFKDFKLQQFLRIEFN